MANVALDRQSAEQPSQKWPASLLPRGRAITLDLIRASLARVGLKVSRVRADDIGDYRRIYSADSLANRRFYNVGAGSFSHAFWTNLDFPSKWYGEVQRAVTPYDLMSGQALPVEDGTAEIIYTSHTVEHVTDRAVERFFRNAFRALRLGGILRVATGPDADSNFRALEAGDADWFYWDVGYDGAFEQYSNIFHQPPSGRPLEERWLHHFASQLAPNDRSPSAHKFSAAAIREIIAERGKIGALDYFTGLCEFQPDRPFNHVSWWNAEKLVRFMRQAGFETIYRSGYGQSAAQVLRNTHFFDNTHPQMTVYVEARR